MQIFEEQGIPVFVGLDFFFLKYQFLHCIKGKKEKSHSNLNVFTHVIGSGRDDLKWWISSTIFLNVGFTSCFSLAS